jgi:hypothetical protein
MADKKKLDELDSEIAAVRDNLRQLTEQAAAQSGAADDDLAAERIAEQEALLVRLLKQRATRSAKPEVEHGSTNVRAGNPGEESH